MYNPSIMEQLIGFRPNEAKVDPRPETKNQERERRINQILLYLYENQQNIVTVRQLSEKFGWNPDTLREYMRSMTRRNLVRGMKTFPTGRVYSISLQAIKFVEEQNNGLDC